MQPRILLLIALAAIGFATDSESAPPVKQVGTYELHFYFDDELILRAHIADAEGNPATDGVVVFQYCSYKGLPKGDITQPDEAPSSACADGSARWLNLRARVEVTTVGDALLNFGLVQVVNVIGFRYKYSHGSEIADRVTEPVDWIR